MAKKIDYGSLFTLRKDGRYQGYRYDEDGVRHAVCDRDPEKLWHKIYDPEDERPVTFREIAEAWHDEHWERIAYGTQVCYNPSYKRAVARLGDHAAADILPAEIQSHLVQLKNQGYSAKVVKTQRTVYNLIYSFAMITPRYESVVRSNPASSVMIPSGVKRPVKRNAPPDDVIEKIRRDADTAYWGLFALLLVSTGLRRGEALALKWSDVDFDAKTISVTKTAHFSGPEKIGSTKTENGIRTVPILPDLLPHLQKASKTAKRKSDYIFHGDDPRKPMSENAYKRHWAHYCKDMGFSSLTAHELRHGYASMLYDADVDVYTAQKLLGHADIQTTMSIYTHLKQERENTSLSKLENYVSRRI